MALDGDTMKGDESNRTRKDPHPKEVGKEARPESHPEKCSSCLEGMMNE
jgi:hypothetical protein